MWPFRTSEVEMISKMISDLEIINSIPSDALTEWKGGVPVYNEKVDIFFRGLGKFWKDGDYVKNIESLDKNDIDSYDLDQIKTVITKLWRHEKFCYGSWETSIKSGVFKSIHSRLVELNNA